MPEPRPADPPPAPLPPEHRRVIRLLLVSAFVVILNETIMGVAIPHLMKDLRVLASEAQWLTTAFLLTMATVIPATGFLLQRLNTRRAFLLAMAAFSLGTLICALAPGLGTLVAGRVVQALGTAVMMPLLMTTIITLVPPAARGKTMGEISTVISVAPALGPTISGFILASLDWRWMFWLVLPIALGSLSLGARRITDVGAESDAPIDLASLPLAALGFGGLVYGLSAFAEQAPGAGSWRDQWPIAGGAVVLALFLWRQVALQRQERALLDLRTLAAPNFRVALAAMAICMVSLFGLFIMLPMYLQHVLGLSTLSSGLLMMPGGLIMGLLAPSVGRLYDRHGPTPLLVPGTATVCAVMWWLSALTEHTPVAAVLAAHVALSLGLAFTFTPLFTASLGSLPPKLNAHGSALLGTVQQLAGAIGTALFVALLSRTAAALAAGGASAAAARVGGIRAAFLCGAICSTLAVVAACFVRKPAEAGPAPEGGA